MFFRSIRRLTALLSVSALLMSCGAPAGTPAPAAATMPVQPTGAATAFAVPQRPLPELDLRADLAALVAAELAPTPTTAADGSQPPTIEGVTVLPLIWTAPDTLFVAATTGMTVAETTTHQLRLYRRADDWQLLAELPLPEANYVDATGVTQVALDDEHVWITVQSGVGAHGGCFDLIQSDGSDLQLIHHACSESPDTALIVDINADGYGELLVNATDHYVFCYACGVRDVRWQLFHWENNELQEKPLAAVQGTDQAAELANTALNLATVGRWQEADALLGSVNMSGNLDAAWLAALIRLNARFRLGAMAESPYPLLTAAFAGDFAAAATVLRSVSAVDARNRQGPLIAGTVAEGNETILWTRLREISSSALSVQPDDVDALLLRGWAGIMLDDGDNDAVTALQRIVELRPDDAFAVALLAEAR